MRRMKNPSYSRKNSQPSIQRIFRIDCDEEIKLCNSKQDYSNENLQQVFVAITAFCKPNVTKYN